MHLRLAAAFCTSIRQDSQQSHALLGQEWQHSAIEQIGAGDRCLVAVELGGGQLGRRACP